MTKLTAAADRLIQSDPKLGVWDQRTRLYGRVGDFVFLASLGLAVIAPFAGAPFLTILPIVMIPCVAGATARLARDVFIVSMNHRAETGGR